MELDHLLTNSGITYPEVSSRFYHDSFCQVGSSIRGKNVKVKCSRYSPGVAQRVGIGIALLFHDCGTRSSRLRPHLTPGKDLVPIVQEAGWEYKG